MGKYTLSYADPTEAPGVYLGVFPNGMPQEDALKEDGDDSVAFSVYANTSKRKAQQVCAGNYDLRALSQLLTEKEYSILKHFIKHSTFNNHSVSSLARTLPLNMSARTLAPTVYTAASTSTLSGLLMKRPRPSACTMPRPFL
jgi:hypothetical protein